MAECKPGAVPVVRLALRREKCAIAAKGLRTPTDVVEWIRKNYACAPQEAFLAVGLSASNAPLGIHVVSLGGIDQSSVDPRVLFSALLLMGATSFLIAHNHPSNSLEPSTADIELTRRLKDAGALLSLRLVDHVIVSSQGSTSFVSRGLL